MNKYESDASRIELARKIAGESIVLLKNEGGVLPLAAKAKIALLGRTQNDTVIGGGGSGSSRDAHPIQIKDALEEAGLLLEPGLKDYYRNVRQAEIDAAAAGGGFDFSKLEGLVASGMIYEIFGKYEGAKEEPDPADDLLQAAAEWTDTAVLVIGRLVGGEECDRRVENDYYLLDSEKELIRKTCERFPKVIAVLNSCGPVDLSWVLHCPQIRGLLFMGSSGEQGANALADILSGAVTPSGKLSQTFALRYEDFPTASTMFTNKDMPEKIPTYETYGLSAEANGSIGFSMSPVTLYKEDIYVGYRYFDSFDKEVLYPFGYGLSYASFEEFCENAAVEDGKIVVKVAVQNLSREYAGKEVVQAYLCGPDDVVPQVHQQLKAFAKTKLLAPGETQVVELLIPVEELAYFDEEQSAYVIAPGSYEVLIGNSSRNTVPAVMIDVEQQICVRRVQAGIGYNEANEGMIDTLVADEIDRMEDLEAPYRLKITKEDLKVNWPSYPEHSFAEAAAGNNGGKPWQLKDVADGRVSMEDFVAQMSLEELAVLCNGYGPGLPFSGIAAKGAPSTINYEDGTPIGTNTHPTANAGYENPALAKYGIYSAYYKDGPASVGKVGWPTGMMLSCTFNMDLLYEFGAACGQEAVSFDVDAWLGPGMNIIRNPIEGRAFEYFSEDPYLAGMCGIAVVRGAQENNDGLSCCPKHFALNEQETYRRGSTKKNIDAADSIVSARAAREIYLKPFEMVITAARPKVIMTSFNKINGTFAGGHRALNTDILRGEWGYDGVVVTDWGDMDIVVDGADAVEAGNDVVMPGGPPVIAQVLKGYEEGRVTIDRMREAVCHLLNFVIDSHSYAKATVE